MFSLSSTPPVNLVDYSTLSVPLPDLSRLYAAVRATDGIFAPLRRCCDAACGDISYQVQLACQTQSATVPGYPGATDAEGRLLCDPGGGDRSAQIEQAIEQILERNPYVLVQ